MGINAFNCLEISNPSFLLVLERNHIACKDAFKSFPPHLSCFFWGGGGEGEKEGKGQYERTLYIFSEYSLRGCQATESELPTGSTNFITDPPTLRTFAAL